MKKRKRTPWPRWAKIARNLLFFLLFALAAWGQLGKPLPYNAALRRAARQYLMPEMDHRTDISRGYWGGDLRVEWTEGAAMLSVPARFLLADFFYHYYPLTEPYPLTEGTNLLTSPWTALLPGTEGPGTTELWAIYTAVFPPADSVTAHLTLRIPEGTFTAEAQRQDDSFTFLIRPEPDEDGGYHFGGSSWYLRGDYAWELIFYDETGGVVNRTEKQG